VIEPGRHRIEETRVNEILQILFPSMQKQVQKFLGMCTFISPFIPACSEKFKTIFDMSCKDFKFSKEHWRDLDYKLEWEKAKTYLQHVTTLYFPGRKYEWVLKTDASTTGFGAVLVQLMPIKDLNPEEGEQARVQGISTGDGRVPVL